jgi:hypothetical protein
MIQNVIILVLNRAGVRIPVVGQPIQAMSEMSITDKTVGIGLPRLWCRAKGDKQSSRQNPIGSKAGHFNG